MSDRVPSEAILKMAADIVVAYLAQGSVNRSTLPSLIQEVRAALEGPTPEAGLYRPAQLDDVGSSDTPRRAGDVAREAGASGDVKPAVPIGESVTDEYIISLEDGQRYRSLRRHLMAKYGMTPADYRSKWGLPPDYPMVAPSYARERSEVAKRIGLGKAAPLPAPRRTRRN